MFMASNTIVLAQIYNTAYIKQPSLHTHISLAVQYVHLSTVKSYWIKLELDSTEKESFARNMC